ncbi:hypothetical protein GCM10020295_18520 [Streptomyces cinereospinus]
MLWALILVVVWHGVGFYLVLFSAAMQSVPRDVSIANTVAVLAFSVPLTMLLGSMAAYVLARYPYRGNRLLYYFFVAGAVFPVFPVFPALVPLFFMVRRLDLLNTYQGLILVYVAYSMPFTVFFMHAFFRAPCRRRCSRRRSWTAPRTPGPSSRSCCRWPGRA